MATDSGQNIPQHSIGLLRLCHKLVHPHAVGHAFCFTFLFEPPHNVLQIREIQDILPHYMASQTQRAPHLIIPDK